MMLGDEGYFPCNSIFFQRLNFCHIFASGKPEVFVCQSNRSDYGCK